MRAVRCAEGGVTVTDVPSPHVASNQVEVRVRSAGICGSDLHLLAFGLPATLGHEFAGCLADGTPVAVEPLAPCGTCRACVSGLSNHCVSGPGMILGVGLDGGMAERVSVPASAIVRLPTGVPIEDACLIEPLAIAVHGLRRARLRGDERVAVIGGGTIGLVAVAAARAAGARVDIEARHATQNEAGARLGAGTVDDREPYDLVIDAAGTTSSIERAVALARPRGTLLVLSTFWEGMTLPGQALCGKEVDLIPSFLYGREGTSRDFDAAASLLVANPEIARAIITHRFPLEAAPEAFRVAGDRAAGAIKVVLEP